MKLDDVYSFVERSGYTAIGILELVKGCCWICGGRMIERDRFGAVRCCSCYSELIKVG